MRDALARHTVVLLDVDADTAWQRCRNGRPLARDRDRFEALHAERAPLYAGLADAILPADRRDEVRQALPAIRALAEAPRRDEAAVGGRVPGVRGGGAARTRGCGRSPARRFLVTDATVGARYADRLPPVEAEVRLEPGERHKTLASVDRVLRALASAGMDHDDHVVALGGGVVGDVAGFCAAIYQRGVPVVHVPTTLVAQVDSAYGGKTGVDLPEGKNYAGAYHQPAAVLADPGALATLPPEELAAGWAEVIKTGLIAGGRAVAPRARARDARARPRPRARVRAREAADRGARRARRRRAPGPQPRPHGRPCDRDGRPAYERYRHGEAVGLGLLAALTLSGRPDLRDEVGRPARRAAGCRRGSTPGIDRAAVAAAVQRDKKRRGGRVGFVLLDAPGRRADRLPRCAEDELAGALAELAAR